MKDSGDTNRMQQVANIGQSRPLRGGTLQEGVVDTAVEEDRDVVVFFESPESIQAVSFEELRFERERADHCVVKARPFQRVVQVYPLDHLTLTQRT